MPNASDTTSIEHRALTLTVRTPQCGHTVWGKVMEDVKTKVSCETSFRKWKCKMS